ncbi:unnamed protein product, partial [Lymnaea stagnalis]
MMALSHPSLTVAQAAAAYSSRSPFGGLIHGYMLHTSNGLTNPGTMPTAVSLIPTLPGVPNSMSPRLPNSNTSYEPDMRSSGCGSTTMAATTSSVESLRLKAKEHTA